MAEPTQRQLRLVRLWLVALAALVFAMVLVGGATRLTESGLSITEWKPVTGALPPMSQADWQAEFQKYQSIPQYRQLNQGMSLDQFKVIYWWEWTHRLLGRVIGAAFLLPFVLFLWRGWIVRGLRVPLAGIFALGAFQGAVGWWMVASGLADRVSVSQYRLAFHLTLACLIYAALVWVVQGLSAARTVPPPPHIRKTAFGILVLVLLQIYLGALVAGLDAGLAFNTWPLIDGTLVPSAERLFFETPLWRNFFENVLTVQFDHRMIAYAIFAIAWLHVLGVNREADPGLKRTALLLALAISLQAIIGIVTLLHQAPLPLALAHQGIAMVVLTIATIHAHRAIQSKTGALVGAPAASTAV